MTREEAIEYCLNRITPSVLTDEKEYRKLKMYKHRIQTGKAGKNAIQTLFDRFGITEHCYYLIEKKDEQ